MADTATHPTTRSAPADAGPYVRTRRAAEILGLSHRTVERWRVRGCGPRYRRHGRVVVYAVDDLRAWSDATARLSTSEPAHEAA